MSRFRGFSDRKDQWGLKRALHWQLMNFLARYFGLRLSYLLLGSGSGRLDRMDASCIPEGYDVRMVALGDLLPFTGSVPDLTADFLERSFSNGDVCVASFMEGELVGFSFRTGTRASLSKQLDILIPKGFHYTYKTWIHHDHRRRNLSQAQGYVRHRSLPTDYASRGIWFVETHNYASLLHGYRHPRERAIGMGFLGWFSLGGKEFPFTSRAARWLGVEVVRKGDLRTRHYR